MTTAACRAKGCDLEAATFMCEGHSALIPPAFRPAIESLADPHHDETAIVVAAIDAVAHKESRRGRSASRPTRVPVQLGLW